MQNNMQSKKMSVDSNALIEIKNISKNDLKMMDQVIEKRLSNSSALVKEITFHIVNSGGKRLRPILTILSSKLFGYEGHRHIKLAAAVEFIHTATLLHDDVVDHSKLRRGKPTANNCWDNKSCILVGDFLFSQSFLLMSEDRDHEVLNTLSKAAAIIAEGEVNQLASISNLELKETQYLEIISAKTAELFAAAAKVGSIVANTSENIKNDMYNFGLNLGIAFQIIDDILDYNAEESNLGKSVGDDFREGKVTLPIIYTYNNCNDSEKMLLQNMFSSKLVSDSDFKEVLVLMSKYRSLNRCFQLANDYIQKAKESIQSAPSNNVKEALEKLLDFSVEREF